ncbi:MAG TPA: peptidyl-prolyl cis-trans isomerase [Thermoanaerobaculia bacterium]|jgi:parvulin-like peptidyl-prolyl isomerase|nr:peptidyl-prolyl cis-trans isomerase [Thermoanaerobaculia bacterium]
MKRWLKAPALHMLALGALLFGISDLGGGALLPRKKRIEIPAHRLEAMFKDFVADTGRGPTRREWEQMIDMQVDDEVLFQYALALGMHENSAAQARLAQIADFVEANPHEATQAGKARAAMELGLGEGDLVVRRILVDSARRLIRSVVLLQKPAPGIVEQFYAAHAAEFTRPALIRISQVAVNGFRWPDSEARARRLLARIRAEKLGFGAALALADETPAPVHLGLLTEQGLQSELGGDFAAAVMKLRPGSWSEPIPSDYGHHLVWVHEYQEARVPPLASVRDQVEQAVLQKLADDWLKLRLRELRAEFEIVVPGRAS